MLKKVRDELRTLLHKVFAVIQDQQQVLRLQPTEERLSKWSSIVLTDSECCRDRVDDEAGDRQRGQIHEGDAISVHGCTCFGGRKCESGLANSTRPDQGQQTVNTEQPSQFDELGITPDKTRSRDRKSSGKRTGASGPYAGLIRTLGCHARDDNARKVRLH
jgi:hypothetical protein